MDLLPLEQKRYPKGDISKETPEFRSWKRLARGPSKSLGAGAVSALAFDAGGPSSRLVATCGPRLHLFSADTLETTRTLSRFSDVAYCGRLRGDGRLAAAGGEEGITRVFDVGSRAVLRSMGGKPGKPTKGPSGLPAVRAICFMPSSTTLTAASDDGTVVLWDVSNGDRISSVPKAHADYIRSVTPLGADIVATGGYDGLLRLWDWRCDPQSGAVLTSPPHPGGPVECVVTLSSSLGRLASSSGGSATVWDTVSGLKSPVLEMSGHQKTVTALAAVAGGERLATGSLDAQVKIFDVSTGKCVFSRKCEEPVLSMAVDASGGRMAVGHPSGTMTTRMRRGQPQQGTAEESSQGVDLYEEITPEQMLSIRAGRVGVDVEAERLRAAIPKTGTSRFFTRGKSSRPQADDHLVMSGRRARLQPYDKLLKRFRYRDALDAALETGRPPAVMSLLDELQQRGVLATALEGRTADGLLQILRFLLRHIANPRFADALIDVAERILDIYGTSAIGESPEVDELLLRLRNKVRTEVQFMAELQGMLGALDMLMAASVM